MKLIFTPIAQEHWEYWKKNDPNITKRIKKLLADILEHPYTGIGKPEKLNGNRFATDEAGRTRSYKLPN